MNMRMSHPALAALARTQRPSTTSAVVRRGGIAVAFTAALAFGSIGARADTVLEWNSIAVNTAGAQSPFAQARYMAITQLAVFEAVNSITRDYAPYAGTIGAPVDASVDAAAAAAAYRVLKNYFPPGATLDTAYAASLAKIADGPAKTAGIATGEAAAAQMIALRLGDGASPPAFYVPESSEPGVWQTTPTCPAAGGVNYHWQNVKPFGTFESASSNQTWFESFMPEPPPALTSTHYAKDYNEVKTVGSRDSTARPQDRSDVARFYAASSPSLVFNLAARQVAVAQGKSLSENARTLALLNMATNDSLVASFATKYFAVLWRPETAIRAASRDGNGKTDPDVTFAPLIPTPCFPSYPSNHASASGSAAEIMRRVYGAGGHVITMENPAVAGVVLRYTTLKQITDDIDDARVFGGIHFRFDQDAGAIQGRRVGQYVFANVLAPIE